MALVTVPVHGQILDLDGLTPAVGTVTFRTLIELNDVVDNVTYQPSDFVATLDVNGEFTINLPTTDNTDILPLNWVYQVYISTTTWRATEYVQIPFAPGTTEFADLTRLDYDPCANTAFGSVPVPPDADDIFVHKAGDTMTGNLVINANLTVNGSAFAMYEGIQGDIMRLMSSAISTGVASGGEANPNADPTKVDWTAMTGWIVDYNSSGVIGPTNPQITYVSTPAFLAQTPVVGVPTGVTWWLVNSAGVLSQQAAKPTPTQRRTHIVLGATAQVGGIVVVDQTLPVIQSQPLNQTVDLMEALGNFSIQGNQFSPNGVNLMMNKISGTIFARAFSHIPSYQDPHTSTLVAQTPVTFRHITAVTGGAGALTNNLNVGFFDPGGLGVVTPVGGGAGTATNFRVWGFGSNNVVDQILIQYGQNTYSNLANAVAAIGTTSYIVSPTASAAGVLMGWISVIRTATNLSNTGEAVFTTPAGKFATP